MGRVVIKWGGGLITEKSVPCIARPDRIIPLADCAVELALDGHDVIIVHGAGSFGHIDAKHYRLNEGYIPDLVDSGIDQLEGVKIVREQMNELNSAVHRHLVDAASRMGVGNTDFLHIITHEPRDFALNSGSDFSGNIGVFSDIPSEIKAKGVIHLTFGDVVDCVGPEKFGILSGDHLMYRIATELPNVTHCIFAMDEDGILTNPGTQGELIPIWNPELGVNGIHNSNIDVTGGIFLKAEIAAEISQTVEHVWFIGGKSPNYILDLVQTGETTGTRIVPTARYG